MSILSAGLGYGSGILKAGGGIGARGLAGAGVGLYAGWNDGSRGRLGGMAAGALAGMAGPAIGRKLMGMNNIGGAYLRGASGPINQAMGWAGSKISSLGTGILANKSLGATSDFARRGYGYASAGAVGMGNAISTNKYGGRALLGLGMLSAGSIGASALRSNSRY